jgi:hypothetical protein
LNFAKFVTSFCKSMSVEAKQMDVVFLIDATGSMASTINAAHNKASEIANTLRGKNPGVDFKFGSVCYRDPIDSKQDTHEVHHLQSDINALVAFFSTIAANGGGDSPEDWVGAYSLALKQIDWRGGAKAIIHIADAPAHGQEYCGYENHEDESPKLAPLIQEVAKRGILLSCIDINEGASIAFQACQQIYDAAGGPKFSLEMLSLRGSYQPLRVSASSSRSRKSCSAAARVDHLSLIKAGGFRLKKVCPEEAEGVGDMPCDGFSAEDGATMKVERVLCECTDVVCTDALRRRYA